MLNLRIIIIMFACLTVCNAYGTEVIDRTRDHLIMRQMQMDINLQHNMMQDQVNAMYYNQPTYKQEPARRNDVDNYSRPTYAIDRPLYKFGE